MTEGITAGGRLLSIEARETGQRRKESLPDSSAFKSILQEDGAKPVTGRNALMPGEDLPSRELRIADLLEKIKVPQQQRTTETQSEPQAPQSEIAADQENGKLQGEIPATAEATSEIMTGLDPASKAASSEQGGRPDGDTGAEVSRAQQNTTPGEAPDPRLSGSQAQAPANTKADSSTLADSTKVLPAETSHRPAQATSEAEAVGRTQKPSSEQLLPQPSNQSKTRPETFLFEQGHDRGGQNSSRQQHGSETGGKPVRVIAAQTTPAPATPTPGAQPLPTSASLGTAVSGALAADPGFGTAAAEAAKAIAMGQTGTPQTVHTLKIQLHPAELGTVTARLGNSGGQLIVELSVETAEARQKLNADGDSMTKALRALGYEIDRVTVQQTSSNATAATNTGSAGRDMGGSAAGNESGRQSGGSAGGKEGERGQTGQERRREETSNAQASGSLYI